MSTATRFANDSAHYLVAVHLPRLERAVARIAPEDLFWRPRPGALSIGNILLHLEGNVRQWILSGIGGAEDHRDRDSEFAADSGPEEAGDASGRILLERLAETVTRAGDVVRSLDEAALLSRAEFQGEEQDLLRAVYHVVEHFAYHTGQAVWIAKSRLENHSPT
jgi:uncharacterized damage-inducible protein DinB